MPSHNEIHDNKFKKYSKKINKIGQVQGKVIPEEVEFERGADDLTARSMDIEIATMNQTLGKFTKTF
jgi:hypothetical protein